MGTEMDFAGRWQIQGAVSLAQRLGTNCINGLMDNIEV
jgi:hypothetical protein